MNDGLPSRSRRRRNRSHAPTSDNAIEMAMDLERDNQASDSPARQVLLKHGRLLGGWTCQTAIEDERGLQSAV